MYQLLIEDRDKFVLNQFGITGGFYVNNISGSMKISERKFVKICVGGIGQNFSSSVTNEGVGKISADIYTLDVDNESLSSVSAVVSQNIGSDFPTWTQDNNTTNFTQIASIQRVVMGYNDVTDKLLVITQYLAQYGGDPGGSGSVGTRVRVAEMFLIDPQTGVVLDKKYLYRLTSGYEFRPLSAPNTYIIPSDIVHNSPNNIVINPVTGIMPYEQGFVLMGGRYISVFTTGNGGNHIPVAAELNSGDTISVKGGSYFRYPFSTPIVQQIFPTRDLSVFQFQSEFRTLMWNGSPSATSFISTEPRDIKYFNQVNNENVPNSLLTPNLVRLRIRDGVQLTCTGSGFSTQPIVLDHSSRHALQIIENLGYMSTVSVLDDNTVGINDDIINFLFETNGEVVFDHNGWLSRGVTGRFGTTSKNLKIIWIETQVGNARILPWRIVGGDVIPALRLKQRDDPTPLTGHARIQERGQSGQSRQAGIRISRGNTYT